MEAIKMPILRQVLDSMLKLFLLAIVISNSIICSIDNDDFLLKNISLIEFGIEQPLKFDNDPFQDKNIFVNNFIGWLNLDFQFDSFYYELSPLVPLISSLFKIRAPPEIL